MPPLPWRVDGRALLFANRQVLLNVHNDKSATNTAPPRPWLEAVLCAEFSVKVHWSNWDFDFPPISAAAPPLPPKLVLL